MFICSDMIYPRGNYHPDVLLKHKKEIFDMCMELQSSDPAFESLTHAKHGDRIKRIKEELLKIMEEPPSSYPGGPADGPRSFTDQDKVQHMP